MKRNRNGILTVSSLFPLIINILIFGIIKKSASSFILFIEVIQIATLFLMGIMASVIDNCDEERIKYRNLGPGFIISGIIMLINASISHCGKNGCINNCGYNACIINCGHEGCICINGIINTILVFLVSSCYLLCLLYKKNNRAIVYLYTGVLTVVSTIISVVITVNLGTSGLKYKIIIISYIIIIKIISFYLASTKIKDKKEKRNHFFYLSTRMIFDILLALLISNNKDEYYYIYFVKYLFVITIYKIFLDEFFYAKYKAEEDKLIETKIVLKKLNNSLNKRNKELTIITSNIEKNDRKKIKLIEMVKDGVIIITGTRIAYINSSILKLLKEDCRENLVGKHYNQIYSYIINGKIVKYNDIIDNIREKRIENKKLYKIGQFSNERYQEGIYYVSLDDRNKVIYVKDISYIKRGNELKNTYNKYLEEEKIKEQFYSNISHELRTPINIIFSAIQLNKFKIEEKEVDKIEKNDKIIMLNCLRLIRTINNFIDVNKITEGYLKPNFSINNIVEVVEDISLACNEYIKKIKSELVFETTEEEIYANVDREMIERVIMNLLSNMVKYGKEGGIINVNVLSDNNNIVIEVSDKGYTIDKKNMEVMFNKFEKINNSLNRKREGSGLGLFLCKELIRLNNGNIRVESNKEVGTKFIIDLPRCNYVDYNDVLDNTNSKDINHRVETEFSDIYL